jgi:hypothetical protein
MVEENKITITANVKSLGEVRENHSGVGYNFLLRVYELDKGVYFFSDKDKLEQLKAKLKPEQKVKLTYVENIKGIQGTEIDVLEEPPEQSVEPPKGQQKIEAEPESPEQAGRMVKTYGKYEKLTENQMKDYEHSYLQYAVDLYQKITKTVKGYDDSERHLTKLIFEKMCTPYIYFIEEDLMRKRMQEIKKKEVGDGNKV